MGIAKFNKNKRIFTFIASDDFEYFTLADLYKKNGPDKVYTILGWFFHTGKFGEQPVFITPEFYINGPKHLTAMCKDIQEDAESVAQINAAMAGFKIRDYIDSKGKTSYSIEWVDLDTKLPF